MNLERYRVPASVSEGVWIELPGTEGARFLVALPSESNRSFMEAQQRAVFADGAITIDDEGKPDFAGMDVHAFQRARQEAFRQFCLLKLPEGVTREQLGDEYWPALKALFEKACDLAADEAKAGQAAKKAAGDKE